MEEQKIIPGGYYKHFKGKFYKVLGIGLHFETKEKMVIYKASGKEKVFVRPASKWFDQIEDPKTRNVVPRFEFAGLVGDADPVLQWDENPDDDDD